ncbi:hypothetical protein ABT294_41760 [Nonomuraea sp. NPDC000554]|uniref:hypothetical protein n=1 Tax=Nonomuraea sp. NPDC000554 TaxID=3154259 RepID=UPI00331D3862
MVWIEQKIHQQKGNITMSQTFMPRLTAPVERTVTGAAATQTAGLDQSIYYPGAGVPFADEGDE